VKTTFVKAGISVMIAAVMLSSCQKGNLSPGTALSEQLSMGVKVDSAITYFAVNNTGVTVVNGASIAAASISVTSAIANINGFRFEGKRRGLQIKLKSNNLSTGDLIAAKTSMTSIYLDTGAYTEIKIKVEFSKSATTTLPLIIKGNFTTSTGTVIPLEFDLNDNVLITMGANDVVVDGKAALVSIITLHLNKLLTGIGEADAVAATQTNGTIIISSTSNSAIYNKILNNLASCADSNGFQHTDK